MKIAVHTIDDKCVWKSLLLDKYSSTRESFINDSNKEQHPLFKCFVCCGYVTSCIGYRVVM